MDPSQQRNLKNEAPSDIEAELSSAGYLLVGGVLLVVGGIVLIGLSHASVADFGGGMLALMGFALAAGAIWLYAKRPGEP